MAKNYADNAIVLFENLAIIVSQFLDSSVGSST